MLKLIIINCGRNTRINGSLAWEEQSMQEHDTQQSAVSNGLTQCDRRGPRNL